MTCCLSIFGVSGWCRILAIQIPHVANGAAIRCHLQMGIQDTLALLSLEFTQAGMYE